MALDALVFAPENWQVALRIEGPLWAQLRREAFLSGRTVEDILTDAVGAFLRRHPVSLR